MSLTIVPAWADPFIDLDLPGGPDINEQMRTIAAKLTPDEMHAVAEFYGAGASLSQIAGR